MDVDIKAVHFDLKDETKELIHAKLEKIQFAADLIVDINFTLTKQKTHYFAEVTINFRVGPSAHIKVECFELNEGIDRLFDKLDHKVIKRKEKVKDH